MNGRAVGWMAVAARLVSVAIKGRQGVSTVVDAYTLCRE